MLLLQETINRKLKIISMRQLKISRSITNRDDRSLDQYLQDIGKLELITAEEEVELAKKIKEGDKKALDQLTKANLRFVVSVAKQYQNQGLSLPDLINEGNIGLIKAAKRFDETRGFKFISYAVWWIRQSIVQALAENSRIVRYPLNKIAKAIKLNKAKSMLEQKLGRAPTNEEFSDYMEIPQYELDRDSQIYLNFLSLDSSKEEGGDPFYETMEDENIEGTDSFLIKESLIKEINRALLTLRQDEREIIEENLGLNGKRPKTLEEIGSKRSLTRERVRQIKEKGLRRLKHSSRSKQLKQYLG